MPSFEHRLENGEDISGSRAEENGPRNGHSSPIPIPIPFPDAADRILARKLSEESIQTELCEGPIPDSPLPKIPEKAVLDAVSDRAELIERLKRGESPTWVPNRHVCPLRVWACFSDSVC
jgi:hypothetical protein